MAKPSVRNPRNLYVVFFIADTHQSPPLWRHPAIVIPVFLIVVNLACGFIASPLFFVGYPLLHFLLLTIIRLKLAGLLQSILDLISKLTYDSLN